MQLDNESKLPNCIRQDFIDYLTCYLLDCLVDFNLIQLQAMLREYLQLLYLEICHSM